MIIIGKMIKGGVALNQQYQKITRRHTSQTQTLIKLLKKARKTAFGTHYNFSQILKAQDLEKKYRENVPIFNYDSINELWWKEALEGKEDICWPGKVKYFALSSGTSGSPSKKIPITHDMILSIRKAGFWHLSSLHQQDLAQDIYSRQILLIGGSTQLDQIKRSYQGDLSGILTKKMPIWLNFLYKPGRVISKEKDWNYKIEQITKKAPQWDIGIISGVPSWVKLLFENIIEHYQLENIHDIWPNLKVYSHGGVSIKPYESSFKKLLGKEILYLETYLASEGFFAFENQSGEGMELILDNGIYYEFIPFNDTNFSAEGEHIANEGIVNYENVEDNQEYALLISTCAGTWRYLIGDTVKFQNDRVFITGRTKHFLSLCGEHLSVDNMNEAIKQLAIHFETEIKEYTVIGVPLNSGFAHHWYIGMDNSPVDESKIASVLDSFLQQLNDDYRTERKSVLTEVKVTIIPSNLFYKWMEKENKIGGQTKFPRVLNKTQFDSWKNHLQENNFIKE